MDLEGHRRRAGLDRARPIVWVADLLVDIVETLAQNGLEVREGLEQISRVIVADRTRVDPSEGSVKPLGSNACARRLAVRAARGEVGDAGARAARRPIEDLITSR